MRHLVPDPRPEVPIAVERSLEQRPLLAMQQDVGRLGVWLA
jgi:hypothetical protein